MKHTSFTKNALFDVVIIGGGVIGTSIARELSRYKLKIALLEKEAELAFGVSKSNSGIIHPGTQNPPDSLKGRLCVEGNRLMRGIARDLGVDFKEVGELIVAFNNKDIYHLQQLKHDAERLGVPGLRMVDRNWLAKHEPNLNKAIIAALHAPTAGIISPYRLVYDLSENAARNGVDIQVDCCVNTIEIKGANLFKVATSQGKIAAHYVINAAGLCADDVCRMVGIRDFTITPRRGQEFLLDIKKENVTNHLIFPLPTKKSKGVLVIKTADGNPMIGPTAEDMDDKEDLATTDAGYAKVLSSVKRLVPAISEDDIIAYFSGLRPVAGNDFIIRHEDKVPGFVTVAGIQSPGLSAAPAIALMVADILRGNGLILRKKFYFYRHRKKTEHLFALPIKKIKRLIRKDEAYGDIVCRCEMVSRKEIELAIDRGATTLDGIKFRTRAQAGRCHGGFCTARIMKILAEKTGKSLTEITKRGGHSHIVKKDKGHA